MIMYSAKTRFAKELLNKIEKNGEDVLIFVHSSVDGDCIGASCGLREVLKGLGYKAKVALCEDLPNYLDYLGLGEEIERVTSDRKVPTLAIATDCAEGSRMGEAGDVFDRSEEKLIIDHHASVSMEGDNIFIVPQASSASELVLYVAKELCSIKGVEIKDVITPKAAMLFLTGMITDTGRYSYTNTNPETLEASAELMRLGGQIAPVMYNCYDRKRKEELLISSLACASARFDLDGKIASCVVTNDLFEKCNAGRDDISEVVSRLRDVEGVVVAIVLREADEGKIRVNIRSVAPFDASSFAGAYGGGGHIRASGCTVEGRDINELRDEMVQKAIESLKD